MEIKDSVIEWLLDGDPAIRWQVKRDLLGKPFKSERKRVAKAGWGQRLLALQCKDGRWTKERGPNGFRGLYIPKWTSTTYTLLLLRRFGIESSNRQCLSACNALVDGSQWLDDGSVAPWNSPKTDACVCGMFLGLLSYFEHSNVDLRNRLTKFLIQRQKSDGGWNCLPSKVSSIHSTITILEGLHLAQIQNPNQQLSESIRMGQQYLLERHLMRSQRTGKIIDSKILRFSFPPRWRYDVLRGLEHFRETNNHDRRLQDGIDLVLDRRNQDGTWNLQNRHSGQTHFEMEKPGKPSRWNTLRSLRILRWWDRD